MEHADTYYDFVKSRVKWLPSLQEDLIHATIGIVGELIELRAANTRENILEELGDIEFYCVHYELAWARFGATLRQDPIMPQDLFALNLTWALDECLHTAGNLLDGAKKLWVYNKSPDQLFDAAERLYKSLRSFLFQIHALLAISEGTLRASNEAKLRLRYPVGYTDAAAQARADKAPGE
jgi:hypothetical protein